MMSASAPAQVVPVGFTNFLLVATCLLSLFFGTAYTVKKPWWRYQMGWNIFVLRVSLGFILLPFTLHMLFGINAESPFYQWFSTVIFVLVPIALIHITYMLFRPDPADRAPKPNAPDSVKGLK